MAIEVHPEDGTLMVTGGQAAMLVLVVLILLRLGLRTGLAVEGTAWHLDALLISDASIVFTAPAVHGARRGNVSAGQAGDGDADHAGLSVRLAVTGAGLLTPAPMSQTPASEAARRRTFAIISHPDAGKTTLTEHLLLLGGAIHAAGRVKARGEARRAKSDWMKIEQERGISVTSAVMTFEYQDAVFNLLDTPGHEDFSEDTYRTLTAADSRGDGDRRRQGHRSPDPQAVRGLPPARHSDHDLRQQDGPRGARSLRTAGRDFRPAADRDRADDVAGRHGAEFQGRARI